MRFCDSTVTIATVWSPARPVTAISGRRIVVAIADSAAARGIFDEVAEPVQQAGEVGVADGGGMVGEPAGRLAGGEAEDRRTQQAFGAFDLRRAQTGLAQRDVHRLAGAQRLARDGRPAQQQRKDTRVTGGTGPYAVRHHGQPLLPRQVIVRRRHLGQQPFHEAVEQVVLVGDVPVQRHRRHVQAAGHRLHGDRGEAVFVGDGQGGGKDRRPADLCNPSHEN
jgi:hypothetical protein